MQPLVTISIPIYNCEDSLENSLDSVRRQTYRNLEVTLINDCTPDDSVRIAEDFIKKHDLKNWKIYHLEQNSGLSVVRNKGIDTATGKYLFFLDSDDEITNDCIEKLTEIIEKRKVEMVVGNLISIKQGIKTERPVFSIKEEKDEILGNLEIVKSFFNGKFPATTWNKLIKLSFLKDNKLYFVPGLYAQDALHSFEMALRLNKIAFYKEPTYIYYLHDKSVIHNRGKRHFDNWFTIGKYIDKAYRAEKDKNRKQLILNYLIRYKDMTLIMNWRAKYDETLWKESYRNYKTLSSLGLFDYFSSAYSKQTKKSDFLMSLPTSIGMKIFKLRWGK